jgi:hypothetical protein
MKEVEIDTTLISWALGWLVANVGPVVRISGDIVVGTGWQINDYNDYGRRNYKVWVEIDDEETATLFALSIPARTS